MDFLQSHTTLTTKWNEDDWNESDDDSVLGDIANFNNALMEERERYLRWEESGFHGRPPSFAIQTQDHMSLGSKARALPTHVAVLPGDAGRASVGPVTDTLKKSFDHISQTILNAVGDTIWFQAALRYHAPALIRKRFDIFLHGFTHELASERDEATSRDDSLESQALRFISCYRSQISRHVTQTPKARDFDFDSDRGTHVEQALRAEASLTQYPIHRHEQSVSTGIDSRDDYELDPNFDVRPVTDVLFGGSAFASFCSSIRRVLYDLDSPKMAQIKAVVLDALAEATPNACCNCSNKTHKSFRHQSTVPCPIRTHHYSITIKTDWKPVELLRDQFGENVPLLRHVVTYTGLASAAVAAPCMEYMMSTWPSSGQMFMEAIEDSLNLDQHNNSKNQPRRKTQSKDLQIHVRLSNTGEAVFAATGIKRLLVDVAQQVSWISSAIRLCPRREDQLRHQYCNVDIVATELKFTTGLPDDTREFRTSCQFEDVPSGEHSCWMSLVSADAVIAHHFPIQVRNEERGVEISIELLARMTGIQHAIIFEGGVVMKGPTCLLVPISRNGDIIQWHLVVPENGRQRLSYSEGIRQCKSRALVDEVDLESLRGTRAIVGWWFEARMRLGDPDINYDNIDYSTAEDYEPSIRFSKMAIGVQQFATAHLEAALGPKDSGYQVKWGNGAYEDTIFEAKQVRVVLYDAGEARAWFANGAEVILHMIRTRSVQRPFTVGGNRVHIPSEDSVVETLLRHRDLELVSDRRQPETLETLVMRYFGVIEDLLALDLGRNARPETAASMPFENQLIGHEFMTLVDRIPIGHFKKCVLAKTSGGWSRLVQDSNALTLFGTGFEDLIQTPPDAKGLCHQWRTMPKNKDYLGVKVEALLDLYKKAGCRLTHEYLTSSRLCWHRGTSLFEECEARGSFQCHCDRVQEIMPKSSVGAITPPETLIGKGAVIFGRSSHGRNQNGRIPSLTIQGTTSLYSQPNISLDAGGSRRR